MPHTRGNAPAQNAASPCRHLSRRQVLAASAGALAGAAIPGLLPARADEKTVPKQPVVLLRSGWQTVNIGDIGHSPGVLALLEQHLPEAEILYWPNSYDRGVEPMLERRFPKMKVVLGRYDRQGKPTTEELKVALDRADLLLHGSGPSVVARRDLEHFRRQTTKPFGIYGTTIQNIDDKLRDLLGAASFVFTRETHSLENLKKAGITQPATGFAPDGTFAIDLLDDEKGLAYLKAHGLEERKFICVVPRLRYTPYHKIRKVNWSDERIQHVETHNAKYAEQDHAKLRATIIRWVRQTGLKVFVCPEMTYQLDIIGPLVVDPLPDDVKKNVVARKTYWLPDEAGSIYKRAHTVISMECHSPIIAAAFGTPCFYMRQPEDTIKGQMYYDIGVDRWVFEIDETEGSQIADRLMEVHANYDAAKNYLNEAMTRVRRHFADTMAVVRCAAYKG